jgi:membrane protease YdiL (CAAX protease family)
MRSPHAPQIETAHVSVWRKARLIVEMGLLYIAAPLLIYDLVYVERVPLFELLPWVFGIFAILLILERNWAWVSAFGRFRIVDLFKVLVLWAILGGALAWYAQTYYPASYLRFPRVAYDLWLQVMLLYPLISVTTQEIIYRVFFFHRYAPLLESRPYLAILLNATLFAFAHGVLFGSRHTPFHWESVAISFVGGLIFAYRYHRTRSFWTVAIEHSLYGNLIFTVGLGRFFFTGVSNF